VARAANDTVPPRTASGPACAEPARPTPLSRRPAA